jgi:hypothetical protein
MMWKRAVVACATRDVISALAVTNDSLLQGRDLKKKPPKYKAGMLTIWQTISVEIFL